MKTTRLHFNFLNKKETVFRLNIYISQKTFISIIISSFIIFLFLLGINLINILLRSSIRSSDYFVHGLNAVVLGLLNFNLSPLYLVLGFLKPEDIKFQKNMCITVSRHFFSVEVRMFRTREVPFCFLGCCDLLSDRT